MGSYDDLRNVIKQITDKTGDANAWQQGLTPQQIRDVNGWLASDGAGYKGYRDPDTGVVYEDRSHQNSSVNPAVPVDARLAVARASSAVANLVLAGDDLRATWAASPA